MIFKTNMWLSIPGNIFPIDLQNMQYGIIEH